MLRHLEMARPHQLLLDHVLDILDPDEGLVAVEDPPGHGMGDVRAPATESSSSERKALRTAISILASFQGTTWSLRRIRRTGTVGGANSVVSLAASD